MALLLSPSFVLFSRTSIDLLCLSSVNSHIIANFEDLLFLLQLTIPTLLPTNESFLCAWCWMLSQWCMQGLLAKAKTVQWHSYYIIYVSFLSDQQRLLSRAECLVERSFETFQDCEILAKRCKKEIEDLKLERKKLLDRVKGIDDDLCEVCIFDPGVSYRGECDMDGRLMSIAMVG